MLAAVSNTYTIPVTGENPPSRAPAGSADLGGSAGKTANRTAATAGAPPSSGAPRDQVDISSSPAGPAEADQNGLPSAAGEESLAKTPGTSQASDGAEAEISAEELRQLLKLRQRDSEVKAHEQAHHASAGQYAAGGPSYTYETGPDGKRYAVGGEVPIDVGKERTPEETLAKMEIVSRAALAPQNPSSADRRIAARAALLSAEARREMQLASGRKPEEGEGQEAAREDSSSGTIPQSPEGDTFSGANRQGNVDSYPRAMVLQAYRNQAPPARSSRSA